MTRSDDILIAAGQALIDKFHELSADDVAFNNWYWETRTRHELEASELQGLTGISTEDIIWKSRSGFVISQQERGLEAPPSYIERSPDYIGKALTREEHGANDWNSDWQNWWLENCPDEYRVHLLTKALNELSWLDAVFLETHGRLPAETGRRYYLGQYRNGRSMGDIVAEIEGNAP